MQLVCMTRHAAFAANLLSTLPTFVVVYSQTVLSLCYACMLVNLSCVLELSALSTIISGYATKISAAAAAAAADKTWLLSKITDRDLLS